MACEAAQHHWVPHDAGRGWVVCDSCGMVGVCKGCRDGDASLPDIFCPQHQGVPSLSAFTYRIIAARLIVLAGTIPGALWCADDSGEWSVVRVASSIEISLWHAATHNAWKVQVYLVDGVAPVFLADGAYPSLTVRSVRPGVWMMAVRDAVSWWDAVEVETKSEFVCGMG